MDHLLGYFGLFASAFLSATLLPLQSEFVLAAMMITGHQSISLLILIASVGNILGSCLNWYLGRFVTHFENRSWFPITQAQIRRVEGWYHRYGRWTLLLSWMPVVGDPLTLVAGLLRESFPVFLVLVAIAKTARYAIVAALALGWL